MKQSLIVPVMLLCLFATCQPSIKSNSTSPTTFNIDLSAPDSLQIFAEGIISNHSKVRDIAISPDEDELFYTLVGPKGVISFLLHMKKVNDQWTAPEVAPFSGQFRDLEPAFSPDGQFLFFASNRPLEEGGKAKDIDIWWVEKQASSWSAPVNAGPVVNTEKDEFYPSVAANGNLYFTATYENTKGREDIYLSEWKDKAYQAPVSLPEAVNTAVYEFNAWISPDEQLLIFSSYGRKDGQGGGDLYYSRKGPDGLWQQAVNPGAPINSPKLDYCPFVDPSGTTLYFTSERSNIQKGYPTRMDLEAVNQLFNQAENGSGAIYRINLKNALK